MDKQLIIALGREVGSGGHEIAEKLAKYYNIPLIDKNIIEEIANKKNVDATDLREVEKNFMFPLVNRNVRGFSSSIQEMFICFSLNIYRKRRKQENLL